MKMIKTRLQNRLSDGSLAQLTRIAIEGPDPTLVYFEEIFKESNHRIQLQSLFFPLTLVYIHNELHVFIHSNSFITNKLNTVMKFYSKSREGRNIVREGENFAQGGGYPRVPPTLLYASLIDLCACSVCELLELNKNLSSEL